MSWMIVRQPDMKFARWSDVVDNFTHTQMTLEEAEVVCYTEQNLGFLETICRVQRALLFPERWEQCLVDIERVHGYEEKARIEYLALFGPLPARPRLDKSNQFLRLKSVYTGLYLCPWCEGTGKFKENVCTCNGQGWIR